MIDPNEVSLPPNVPHLTKHSHHSYTQADVRRMRANYYGKIALIDDWIGHITIISSSDNSVEG
jgi:hypothetical protein